MVSYIIIPKELIVVIGCLWILISAIIWDKYYYLMDVDMDVNGYGHDTPASVWITFTLVMSGLGTGVAVIAFGFIYLIVEAIKLLPRVVFV
jgi:hypothetical protein